MENIEEKLKELADKGKIGTKIYLTREKYNEFRNAKFWTNNILKDMKLNTILGMKIIIVDDFAIHTEFKNRLFKGGFS